jgi:cyclopropane fatty-acyl-phospholipid synthase-like methyltransferase
MAEAWYKEWFDTELYEQLYANRDEKEAKRLSTLLEDLIPHAEYPNILDLGCGRGRHSIALADKGYQVTGIDLSPRAIEVAREKAEAQQLDQLHFEVRDMRDPLDQQFDAIVNLFTTFGYFESDEENAAVFDSMAQMLKPQGRFIMDYLNAPVVKKNLKSHEHGTMNDVEYHIRRYIEDGAVYKHIEFTDPTSDQEKYTYTERVKLYSLEWFREQLQQRDLKLTATYGDYDGSSYTKADSPRLLMVFDRQG